jgi:pimeloyl-ACP methyl ester carboxylesterase
MTQDGRALEYRTVGDGPPLVCHPGGPGVSTLLFGDLAGLDRELSLIQLSPRGVDGSDPAETYELEDYAADLEELRGHLGLERMDLLGHSAGGFMSMVYAATFPDHVGRLVLCGTFARFSDEFGATFKRYLEEREDDPRFAEAVAARRSRDENPPDDDDEFGRLAVLSLPLLFGRYGPREQALFEQALEAGATYHIPALRYFNERIQPIFDLRPILPRIKAPALVITGQLDPWGAGGAGELASHLADARVVVLPDVGHMPWMEGPEAFRRAVLDFLGD